MSIFQMAVFGALLGIREGLIGSHASSQLSREKKHNYLTRLAKNNDVFCLQETHGKDEFLQAIQALAPQFRLDGTFVPNNVSAGGSAMCIQMTPSRRSNCYTCDHLPGP